MCETCESQKILFGFDVYKPARNKCGFSKTDKYRLRVVGSELRMEVSKDKTYHYDTFTEASIKIDFCPSCGKKLNL